MSTVSEQIPASAEQLRKASDPRGRGSVAVSGGDAREPDGSGAASRRVGTFTMMVSAKSMREARLLKSQVSMMQTALDKTYERCGTVRVKLTTKIHDDGGVDVTFNPVQPNDVVDSFPTATRTT